jgi:hypothetical protein
MTFLPGLNLHRALRMQTTKLVEEIDGPMIPKGDVVDRLLDLRNLGRGRDLGLELTIDEMLADLPAGVGVSSEWWMDCLAHLADHAAFLAAGYPAVTRAPMLVAV